MACADYGFTPPTTGPVPSGPGTIIMDKGKITLVKDTPKAVLFTQISVLNATQWIMPTASCYDAANFGVGYEITNKTGTGFTVTASEDSTFEYICVKI